MSVPPSGFERFAKFLAADISAERVDAAIESDTIWIESVAGRKFELDQRAEIRGCYRGSFPEIDSYDENYWTRKQGPKRAVISLKVIHCFPKEDFDPAWETAVINKIWAHLKELSRFRGASGNLLPKTGGDRQRVEIGWDDFDIGVLRVGVPKSVFKANKRFFAETQRGLTDSRYGGVIDMRMKPIDPSKEKKSLLTDILPFGDDNFVELPGTAYEVIKGASIHGDRPGTFKTIDKLDTTKNRVISYKSIDLNMKSYEASVGSRSLNPVKGTLRGYISALKDFRGASLVIGDKTLSVKGADFTEKRLSVAIPMLSANELDFYKTTFEDLVDEAANAHITLRVHRVA